jgi:hypothetical protein
MISYVWISYTVISMWNHTMISFHDIMLRFNSSYPIWCQDYDFMLWCQDSALDIMLWNQFWIHEIINMKPIFARAGPVLLRFSGGSSSLQHREFTLNTPLIPFICFPNRFLVVLRQRGAACFGCGTSPQASLGEISCIVRRSWCWAWPCTLSRMVPQVSWRVRHSCRNSRGL